VEQLGAYGEKSLKKGWNIHAAHLDVPRNFIIKAWSDLNLETVIGSFKKYSISNSVDGTEDDLLFTYIRISQHT
jgi:hypothetical protein